jgi:archaellum component FlaC
MSNGIEERVARLEAQMALVNSMAITRSDIDQFLQYMGRIDANLAAVREDVSSLKRQAQVTDGRLERLETNVVALREDVQQLQGRQP